MNDLEKTPNQTTQPTMTMPVFNNWQTVAMGWYFVSSSKKIKVGQVHSFDICGQKIVIYRGEDKKLRALDAFCPHMGTHLGVGKVIGNNIRCFFHHWQFNEEGKCVHIPCQKEIPTKAKLKNYSVIEKYKCIWVYPDANPQRQLSDFRELKDQEVIVKMGKPYYRSCHHHVTMINGIDPQHLKTVHSLDIEMDVEVSEENNGNQIDITLTGAIGKGGLRERLATWLFGSTYSYSMRYDHANNGLLTLVKDVFLFGTGPRLPTLHMIFAYRTEKPGKTLVQPIYVTKKRKGVFGSLSSRFLIWLTQKAFFALQGEDGLVYENMRFFPNVLLSIDKPVALYVQYVNKQLISAWRP